MGMRRSYHRVSGPLIAEGLDAARALSMPRSPADRADGRPEVAEPSSRCAPPPTTRSPNR
jgi:hypothetical protein